MSYDDAYSKLRVGLFAIGHEGYWSQFAGLEQRLREYADRVAERLRRPGIEVVNLGMIDSPEKAARAGHEFRSADVDLYPSRHNLRALLDRAAGGPAGEGPGHHPQSFSRSCHRLRRLQRHGRPQPDDRRMAGLLPGLPGAGNRQCLQPRATFLSSRSPACWTTIRSAGTKSMSGSTPPASRTSMEHNRLGVMGHYYGGMLDIYSDLTQQCALFRRAHRDGRSGRTGGAARRSVSEARSSERVAQFQESFDVQPDCSPEELERAARTSVALDRLVESHDLGSLAYYYMGTGNAGQRRRHQLDHPRQPAC